MRKNCFSSGIYCTHGESLGDNETITIGNTITIKNGLSANVVDRTGAPNHTIDFYIPIGRDGIKGDKGEIGKGLEILGTVETIDNLPDIAENGDSYLVGVADPRTLYIYDGESEIWIDQGLLQGPDGNDGLTPTIGENGNWFLGNEDTGKPSRGIEGLQGLRGPQGEQGEQGLQGIQGLKGEKGDKGETGTGLKIIGTVDTIDDLPDEGENGDAYLVGITDPRVLYIYDATAHTWIDQGTLQGEQGENGATPTIGANGNWFINGIDTGMSSKGDKGDIGEQGVKGEQGEIGVTGPQGVQGIQGIQGEMGDKGETGDNGEQGPQGIQGEQGLQGVQGIQGEQGLQGERGEKGDTGERGPSLIREGYFVTLNDPNNTVPVAGLEIVSNGRLPIKRLEVQTADLFVLDPTANTILFNITGTYQVIFNFNGYVNNEENGFNPATDFVSVGFRAVNGEIVYVGANDWSLNQAAKNITGFGIFEVTSIAEPFELVNLSTKSLFINGGKIENTTVHSYFSCPIVTIIIKRLS